MKKLTIADWFSIYRIAAIPFLVLLIILNKEGWFIGIIISALFTDWIDGFLARKMKQQSQLGSTLDSIGDMGTLVLMVAGLFRFQKVFLEDEKWFLGIAGGFYVLQVIIALIKFRKTTSYHTYSSKTAFAVFGIFYIVLFIHGQVEWLFLAAFVLMCLSVLEDIALTFLSNKPDQSTKGIFWKHFEK